MQEKLEKISLLVLSDYGSVEKINLPNILENDIVTIMKDIDWRQFHQVVLSRNDNDWIEVGGNLGKDGLSCMYEENGEVFVIYFAPTSVNQLIEILISYYRNDGEFNSKYHFTGEFDQIRRKEEDAKKYEQWKKNYKVDKREKYTEVRRFLLVSLIVLMLSTISYYWIVGELQFLGQNTEYAKAKIVNTQFRHLGAGNFIQVVTYEFVYNSKVYSGDFKAGRGWGTQKIGDYVKIKFSTSNPDRSLIKGVYKNH